MVGTNAAEGAACLALADLEGALKLLLTLVVLAGAFAKAGFTCGTIAIAARLVKAWTLGLAKAAFFAAGTVAELALTTWCAVVTFKAGAIACAAFLVETRALRLAKAAFFAARTVTELALTTWCAVVTFKTWAVAIAAWLVKAWALGQSKATFFVARTVAKAAFLVEMRTLTAFTAWATVFIEAGTLRAAKAALVTVTARTAAVIAETGAIAARTATIFLLEAWAL